MKKILIKANPETIWTLMVQHLKYPEKEAERGSEWDELVIKNINGEALTAKREDIGVKTRWYYKFYFYTFKWDDEVVEWEPLRKITWKAISTWEMIDSFTITPENSETWLIYEMDYTPPYGTFGGIWYRLFVHKHLKQHLDYTLRQMKKSAETIEAFKGQAN
jgi:uncharacterized membrane protein